MRLRVSSAVLVLLFAPFALGQERDVESLRDITGIERTPISESGKTSVPWVVGAGIAMATAVLALTWARRNLRRRRTAITADGWARHELDRITGLDLGAKGQGSRHVTLLSMVLRAYVEKRLGIPARRRTTAEFLRVLNQDGRLPGAQKTVLSDLLSNWDLIKFSGGEISLDECRHETQQAKEFVETTSHHLSD